MSWEEGAGRGRPESNEWGREGVDSDRGPPTWYDEEPFTFYDDHNDTLFLQHKYHLHHCHSQLAKREQVNQFSIRTSVGVGD